MSPAKLAVGLLVAAALAVWIPALRGGARGPAGPAPARVERASGDGTPPGVASEPGADVAHDAEPPRRATQAGERAELLSAMERLLPDGGRGSLVDLAEAEPRHGAAAAAWDELALRWGRRVARERDGAAEDDR